MENRLLGYLNEILYSLYHFCSHCCVIFSSPGLSPACIFSSQYSYCFALESRINQGKSPLRLDLRSAKESYVAYLNSRARFFALAPISLYLLLPQFSSNANSPLCSFSKERDTNYVAILHL